MSLSSPARPAPAAPSAGRPGVAHGPAFWAVAFAFLTAMAFSTVPTPLYVLYQARDGFSSFTITVIFAAYAVGVVLSLFLVGHLSDRLGRRRVLLWAVALEIVTAGVFLAWQTLAGLLVARLLTGLAVGAVTATATAWLAELHGAARPGRGPARAEVVATAANLGGLGSGTLAAGLLAQWAPEPLHLPYGVFLALLVVAFAAVLVSPETVAERRPLAPYRPQRVSVPAEVRGRYLAVCGVVLAGFALLGLFTSLAPQFVAVTMHHPSRALAGAVAFLVFASAAAAQVLAGRLPARRQLTLGPVLLSAGLLGVTAGALWPSLWLFLLGGLVAGAGSGTTMRGAIATIAAMAAPQARGEALAGMFLAGYVGLSVPVLGLGVATLVVPTGPAVAAFSALLVLVAAVSARRALAGPA